MARAALSPGIGLPGSGTNSGGAAVGPQQNSDRELVVLKTLILPLNDSSFEYGREEQRHELNIIVIY